MSCLTCESCILQFHLLNCICLLFYKFRVENNQKQGKQLNCVLHFTGGQAFVAIFGCNSISADDTENSRKTRRKTNESSFKTLIHLHDMFSVRDNFLQRKRKALNRLLLGSIILCHCNSSFIYHNKV